MKVLVTGGCGFIGSHVCEFYRNLNWEVISYDNMTKYELGKTGYDAELARLYNFNFLKKIGVNLVNKDIRVLNDLLVASDGCDFIIHTAAQPAMTLSLEKPYLDFTTNVVGTYNVLETAKQLNIPTVSCSTIHVYGTGVNDSITETETRYTRTPVSIDENAPVMTGTITPLHASKFSAESYVRMFIDSYKVKAASFRLSGLYGTRQFGGEDHGWVANFAIRALTDRPIHIFNTGKQVRDILYASDVCKAFHAFYENQKPGVYNIGGGLKNSISLIESISYLEKLMGRKINYSLEGERWGDLYYWVSDTTKAEKNLGWKPKIRHQEGIQSLVRWIKENLHIFHSAD